MSRPSLPEALEDARLKRVPANYSKGWRESREATIKEQNAETTIIFFVVFTMFTILSLTFLLSL